MVAPHFVRKGCSRTPKIAILLQFCRSTLILSERGSSRARKIAILPQFLTIDPGFVRKDCSGTSRNFKPTFAARPSFRTEGLLQDTKKEIFLMFLPIDPHFVRNGWSGTSKIAIYRSFCRSTLISCEMVTPGQVKPPFYHFVWNGCSGTSKIAILPQFLPIDPHFVRKGWHFVTRCGTILALKKERQTRRERDGEQVWKWEDVKMSICEGEQMWRWAGRKITRWADVKMSRCVDVKLGRWEED